MPWSARMMAADFRERYATPQAVMHALVPFLKLDRGEHFALSRTQVDIEKTTAPTAYLACRHESVRHVLAVDDDEQTRNLCKIALSSENLVCDTAKDGAERWRL